MESERRGCFPSSPTRFSAFYMDARWSRAHTRRAAPALLLSPSSPRLSPTPDMSQSQSSSHASSPASQPRRSLPHDYLSCEDVSAQSQRVTCCFLRSVRGIGFVDASCESTDVAAGAKLELPLWLARVFAARKVVEIELPKGYSETYREILQADASVVDLHKLGPDYYKFAQHLLSLGVKDGADIAKSLVSAFHQRFHHILDFSMNSSLDTKVEMLKFQAQLDNSELDLLVSGCKEADSYRQWESRTCDKVIANDMVSTLNKKKKVLLDDLGRQTD